MSRPVAAELRKTTSTRLWLALLAGMVALVGINVVALVLAAGQQGAPPLSQPAAVLSVWGSAGTATSLVLVVGILSMTTEYRYGTITPTFLGQPHRSRVLTAKMVAGALVGLAFAAVAVVETAALAVPLLAWKDAAAVPTSDVVRILAGSALAIALYGVLGVSVGALIRNQVAAIVVALLWVLLVESLVVTFLPAVGKWLPGGAAAGLRSQVNPLSNASLLPPWASALVLVAYAVVLAVAAVRVTLERDVT